MFPHINLAHILLNITTFLYCDCIPFWKTILKMKNYGKTFFTTTKEIIWGHEIRRLGEPGNTC